MTNASETPNLLIDTDNNVYEVPAGELERWRVSEERTQEILAARRSQDADVQGYYSGGYTVQRGDNLSHIAHRLYGDPRLWPLLFAANRHQIANPHLIQPGQVLRIP